MKKSVKLQVLLFPLMTFLFLPGCQEERNGPKPEKTHKSCFLTKITYSGTEVTNYHYDNQHRLQRVNFSGLGAGQEDYIKTYEYDTAGRVVKEIFKNTYGHEYSYFTFDYNDKNLLAKISFFTKAPGTSNYNHAYDKEIVYTGGKRIAKVTTHNPSNPQEGRYDIYIYDANQNITKVIENVVNGSVTTNDVTTEYTYDQKNNPFQDATFLGVGPTTNSRNNILTEKVTYHLSGLIKSCAFTYEYNQKGYPVKQTQVSGTRITEWVNEYACLD